ncbi:MAG: hypothetical protein PCFJNLEI_04139 [Verrucomicrobiae bacterium]|nr:hypothetical protein [Verrucomicrobiae bacterium]
MFTCPLVMKTLSAVLLLPGLVSTPHVLVTL